jgi:hypothetical protein
VIPSPAAAAAGGAALGAASGWLSRLALKRALGSSEAVFYSVFVGGIFCRLGLLVGAVCLLRFEKCTIIISFAAALIVVQMLFEAFPLKKNGIKRDS